MELDEDKVVMNLASRESEVVMSKASRESEVMKTRASRESEVVMNARARLASRVRKISDEGRRLVAASIARIARKLGQNARGIKARGIKPGRKKRKKIKPTHICSHPKVFMVSAQLFQ